MVGAGGNWYTGVTMNIDPSKAPPANVTDPANEAGPQTVQYRGAHRTRHLTESEAAKYRKIREDVMEEIPPKSSTVDVLVPRPGETTDLPLGATLVLEQDDEQVEVELLADEPLDSERAGAVRHVGRVVVSIAKVRDTMSFARVLIWGSRVFLKHDPGDPPRYKEVTSAIAFTREQLDEMGVNG